jgi:dTDP-glucose 4,6-dehydratase
MNTINDIPIPIYGDGSHIREYLFVEDKINAIMIILHKGAPNEIYNIGSGNEFSNAEIVDKVAKALNKAPKIEVCPDRKGHDFRYSVDCSKLKELGWCPKFDFDAGLNRTIEWYLKNKNYLDDQKV